MKIAPRMTAIELMALRKEAKDEKSTKHIARHSW
jgi:hypothetical protein